MTHAANIFVYDDLHPEDNAMVQALYSRSPASVEDHIVKVRQGDSGKFMERFYIGYGHASIGDCGSTTVFIEQASMLVAKAIQSTPLYSGQEASTRYLDFAVQRQIDPYQNAASAQIQQDWIALYNQYMPIVKSALSAAHPFNAGDGVKETQWEKGIAARAFDLLRALLPCGTSTLLSWHTNLRQARDHLRYLKHHPLPEVRDVATQVFDALRARYKNSFNGEEMTLGSARYQERDAYAASFADHEYVPNPEDIWDDLSPNEQEQVLSGGVCAQTNLFDTTRADKILAQTAANRPLGASLPRALASCGVYRFDFLMDFGSFRDLQRHRNGYCVMPLVGPRFGFSSWYLNEWKNLLTAEQFQHLTTAVNTLLARIKNLQVANRTPEQDQYLYPMGMACLCQLTYTLPQTVYVSELRSGQTVHGSLRPVAQAMGNFVAARHPHLKVHIDMTQDSWSIKRGGQDISEKPGVQAA
jgi:thymidylate synthase ThyX